MSLDTLGRRWDDSVSELVFSHNGLHVQHHSQGPNQVTRYDDEGQ